MGGIQSNTEHPSKVAANAYLVADYSGWVRWPGLEFHHCNLPVFPHIIRATSKPFKGRPDNACCDNKRSRNIL